MDPVFLYAGRSRRHMQSSIFSSFSLFLCSSTLISSLLLEISLEFFKVHQGSSRFFRVPFCLVPQHSGPEGLTIIFLVLEFLCFRHKFRAYKDTLLSFQVHKTSFKAQNDIGKCGIRTHDHFLSVLDLEKCNFQLQFSYICHHVPGV